MRIILAFLFLLFLGSVPAQAEWVNIQDVKEPIKLLDTDNIYKLNHKETKGTVFRIRFVGKDKKELAAAFFADFENKKAGVISVKPYKDNSLPNFFMPDDIKMKDMSEYKTNFNKIQEYTAKKELKDCPEIFTIQPVSDRERAVMKSYIEKMDVKIRKYWTVPKSEKEDYAVVRLKLNREGKIEASEIVQSSGNEMFEQTVLQTLAFSEPFGAFPKQYEKDFMWMNYVFSYKNVKANNEQKYTERDTLYKVNTAANVLSTLLLIPLMILGID